MQPLDSEDNPKIWFDKAGLFPVGDTHFELRILFKMEYTDKDPMYQVWSYGLTSIDQEEAKWEAVAEMIALGIPVSVSDFEDVS